MPFREHRPPRDLERHVDCVWVAETPGGASTLLPDGCVEIVVEVEGRLRLGGAPGPPVRVVGLTTRPLAIAYDGPTRLAGIRLTPAGAARLGPAEGAGMRGLAEAAEHLARRGDPRPLLDVAGAALRGAPADARLEHALFLLRSGMRVGAVAREVGISTRQLDRWCGRRLGLAPKLLGRLARFQRAFELGIVAPRGAWAHVAARCGYADQAHLVRDFVEFCGEPPERLRAARV
jgi:AraC-like DNA-binding protein